MGAVPRGPLVEEQLAFCRPVRLQAAQLYRLLGVCVFKCLPASVPGKGRGSPGCGG